MNLDKFFHEQLEAWPDAADRYKALGGLVHKCQEVDGTMFDVMFNPSRAISTQAKVDRVSISNRPCFLCRHNRPAVQRAMAWRTYEILVNPYPLFDRHFTIASITHEPQHISVQRITDMIDLCKETGLTVFYNGPKCGASAPDHFHFQAVPAENLNAVRGFPFRVFTAVGAEPSALAGRVNDVLASLPVGDGDAEPMVNIIASPAPGGVNVTVIPRRAHRPACYDELMISPASVDLCGHVVATRKEDFKAVDKVNLKKILGDVAYLECQPILNVGIMTAPKIDYTLNGHFATGRDEIVPLERDATFTLENVTIGIGFHWERKESQTFKGVLRLLRHNDGTTTAINQIGVEDYLMSVISSEMSAHASLELLKAHAVISRSWVLAQMGHKGDGTNGCAADGMRSGADEIVKWYDHDDHTDFDVCADDHCQRYQGVTRATTAKSSRAVFATWGEVLTYNGELCDARFSKCCGGVMEEFENCWEPRHHDYLVARADTPTPEVYPDLRQEAEARRWILGQPEAFCNTHDPKVLSQVLNDYDRETPDFYRWEVVYSVDRLSALIRERSGIDFGKITALEPLERGSSGRIVRLRIVGSKRTMIVGKELEIRRWLSESHLYSSAFVIDRDDRERFIIRGAGWGHGVGLCQIGAAMMAEKGYTYREILSHYFKNAEISRRY